MKPLLALALLSAAVFLPSCTTVVDPTPAVSTQATTTTTVPDPYTGTTTYKKTTTTTGY